MHRPSENLPPLAAAALIGMTVIVAGLIVAVSYLFVSEDSGARGGAAQAQQTFDQDAARAQQQQATRSLQENILRFESQLMLLQQQYAIPGMSVAVVRGEEVLFARGFGTADNQSGTPANEHTPYRIASLTKPMAAVIMLQLVQEGKIDLDTPLAAYDPDYAALCVRYRDVYVPPYHCDTLSPTVRHHLTHTAQGVPGEGFLYNGDLYALLSRAAEHVTDKPFEQLLQERILGPLQMNESAPSQQSAPEVLLANLARPHQQLAEGQVVRAEYPELETSAAAGVVSTVLDVARFSVALDQHRLLSPQSRAAMLTPSRSNSGQRLPYGLGWFVQDIAGRRVVWHYGWWPDAYSALLIKIPEQELTMVLLANSDGASAPFGLGDGNLLHSPFAVVFINSFVNTSSAAPSPATTGEQE
jgi:CubicO group peptidase (beta-lactamase class C family)